MTAIGWYGLGAFGLPLACRAVDCGYQVVPVRGRGRVAEFVAAGGSVGDAVPGECEVVVLCLPDASAVKGAVEDVHGAAYVVDFSSHDPRSARELAATLAEKGVGYVDCPVSGSVEMARTGRLTGFAGAQAEDLPAKVVELVEQLCQNLFWMGAVGQGQALKLVNQVVHIGNVVVLGEGLALAKTLGVPLSTAVEALKASSGSSRMVERFGQQMADGVYPRQFSARLAGKDIGNALRECPDLPVATLAHARLNDVITSGHGEDNFTRLARVPVPGEAEAV